MGLLTKNLNLVFLSLFSCFRFGFGREKPLNLLRETKEKKSPQLSLWEDTQKQPATFSIAYLGKLLKFFMIWRRTTATKNIKKPKLIFSDNPPWVFFSKQLFASLLTIKKVAIFLKWAKPNSFFSLKTKLNSKKLNLEALSARKIIG